MEFSSRWDYLTWDPATRAWDGMRLALDISHGNLLKLLADTNSLVLWPPLHSYLQVPFFLLMGMNFHSASSCSLIFLALFFPCITFLYQQLERGWAGWLTLMAFSATSPFLLGFGSTPMLEIFGATLTAFSAGLYLKQSRWFPLSLTFLFFLKFNYCVYLLLPVAVSHGSIPHFWSFAKRLTPFRVFVIAYLMFLALILVNGGLAIGPLIIRGIGNPAYVLFLIVVARAFLKRQHHTIRHRIRGTGWEWFVVPVFFWMLIPVPNRVKSIVTFAVNTSLNSPSPFELAYYIYYFRKFHLYFADHGMAWLCLAVAVSVVYFFRKRRDIVFLGLLFFLPLTLMTINQNKQERLLYTFLFTLWVLCSFGIARIANSVLRYAAVITFCLTLLLSYDSGTVREFVKWPFSPFRFHSPINFIAKRVAEAGEIRVLGVTNEMSPASIAYHVARRSGFRPDQHLDTELEKDPPSEVQIICINTETQGVLRRSRRFAGGIEVSHYSLP